MDGPRWDGVSPPQRILGDDPLFGRAVAGFSTSMLMEIHSFTPIIEV